MFIHLCLTLAIFFSFNESYAKPFRRALILAGGELQFATYLGVLEGLKNKNWEPDLIIATCGGSIPGGLIHVTQGRSRSIVFSENFYKMLKQVKVNEDYGSLGHNFKKLLNLYSMGWSNTIPALFGDWVVHVPQRFAIPELNRSFVQSRTSIVVISSRILFSPDEVGRDVGNRKLYRETFFTDADTARYLDGFLAPLALSQPKSSIELNTEVITNFSLMEAARASIADPFMIEPLKNSNEYFAGAPVDLYPIELANLLADEVVTSFVEGFESIFNNTGIKASFNYDFNERVRQVHDQYADYWLDFTDRDEALTEFRFGLKTSGISVNLETPRTFQEYQRRLLGQWNFGKERAEEALFQVRRNWKGHIRDMNSDNASSRLRDEYK